MQSASWPDDEPSRLAELRQYGVLDTPSEAAFDDLTALAAQICGTPISLISLVDADRQWFKAKVGIEASETPRDIAFCAHAIHGRDLFMVSDATHDERFADNPLVTAEPSIRFYAGMPLVTPSGHALGTLCVIDRVPKQLTVEQMAALRMLSRQVVHQLELKRRQIELEQTLLKQKQTERSNVDIIRAIEWGFEGVAFLDKDGCYTYMNAAHAAIYGYKSTELIGQSWKTLYEPEWIARIEQEYFPVLLNTGHWSGLVQGRTGAGGATHVELSLILAEEPCDPGRWLMCTCREVTGRVLAQRALEANQKSLAQAQAIAHVGSWESNLRTGTETWSDEQFRIFGYVPHTITPTVDTFRNAIHPDDRPDVYKAVEETLTQNRPYEISCRITRPSGDIRHVLCRGSVTRDADDLPISMLGTVQDITEQKTVERVLSDTVQRLDLATKSGGIGVWDYYIHENRLVWDQRMYELYGYTADNFPGAYEAWTTRLHPEDRTSAEASLQSAIEGHGQFNMEFRVVLEDQSIRHIKASAIVLRDEQGSPVRMIGINFDITNRKRIESVIKASEERVNLAVSAARVGIFEHDHRNGQLYWSPILRNIFRVTSDESASLRSYLNLIHQADRERVHDALRQAHDPNGNGEFRIEHKIVFPDGDVRHISLRSLTYFIDEETARIPTRTVGTVVDITERKLAEEQFQQVVELAPNGMLMANQEGVITLVNAQVERWFGYDRQELIGQPIEILLPERFRSQHPGHRAAFYHNPQARAMGAGRDLFGHRKDGSEFPLEIGLSPIQTAEGTQVLAAIVDITARKQAEDTLNETAQVLTANNLRLQEANQAVLTATRAKSEFLATMSHEIRTPMNAIIGMSELLQETQLTPDQANYVGRVSRAAASLMDLINAVLDLSKIEAGYMALESTPFDLHNLADAVAELMAGKASAKHLELLTLVHPDVPRGVVGDPTRLNQVLVNLVGNAIKFTESGHVMLKIEPAGERSPTHALRFSVSDTGIGIPTEKLQDVFEPFTQADSTTTRKYGGTGLGLSISQRLVELMGGRLQADSTPGQGSTFSFVIQLPEAPFLVQKQTGRYLDLHAKRILIVDDNDTNVMIVREHLSRSGVQILEASGGAEALALLDETYGRKEPIDLAILDFHMPGMNGLELAEAIRSRPELATLPLVMHVSDLQRDDGSRARSSGIRSYLYKPLSRQRLMESLAMAMDQSLPVSIRQEAEAVQNGSMLSTCRILLVEDLEDNREVVSLFLRETPYHVDMAENGAVGLTKFKEGAYDVVLMDMQMPVMDGIEATTAIRRWEREERRTPTPIIALTANAFKEEVDKSLAAGCTAHVTKPIKKNTLMTTITQYARASKDQAA